MKYRPFGRTGLEVSAIATPPNDAVGVLHYSKPFSLG